MEPPGVSRRRAGRRRARRCSRCYLQRIYSGGGCRAAVADARRHTPRCPAPRRRSVPAIGETSASADSTGDNFRP